MSPGRPEPYARAFAVPVAELGLRTFWLGVTGCTSAVAVFLLARLTAWPPHEDETLALFVGRKSLGGLFKTVQTERGGAPLHFLFAWLVAHLGGGIVGLRLFSALFAVASVPVIALLCVRLAGRTPALAATALVSASWMLLFHGIYGRMYSLFLLTSALSYVAFLAAVANGGRRRWALWAVAILATVATHPYGVLVLATQVVYVLARARTRPAIVAIAAVAVLGSPFWYSDHVLAGRFDVGVGAGGQKLDGPGAVLAYLYRVAGDFTAGFTPVVIAVIAVAVVGARALWRRNRDAAFLTACVVLVPTAAFVLARFGQSTSPESRHLIFVLPFFALLVAARADRPHAQTDGGARRRARAADERGGRVGLGQDGSASIKASPRRGSRRVRPRPRGSPAPRGPTTSCSGTSRSTSAPGSAPATDSRTP